MPGGDYTYRRTINQNLSTTRDFAATDGNLTLLTGKTNYTIYVQRIIVTISTSAAQAITFQDSAGSPVYVNKIAASPAVDSTYDFDKGPDGKALTSGKNLVMAMTAGNAGNIEIYAYLKPDALA